MKHPVVKIPSENGPITAIAPVVISASRATDIPAFYGKWLLERLRAGYCEWINPFNPQQKQFVSFVKCKAIVFWSKNPAPLIPWLGELDRRGIKYYFHFTLNDYAREGFEPNVPPLATRLATFKRLSQICPVIWRYDPVIASKTLTVAEHLSRIRSLACELAPFTRKLAFSFVNIAKYRRVKTRLGQAGIFRELDFAEKVAFAKGLVSLNKALPSPLELAACGGDFDFTAYDIAKNRCVDPVLLEQLCPPPDAPFLLAPLPQFEHRKDPGQRKECSCALSKDIGAYKTQPCGHRCAYCYAGHDK